MSNTIRKISHRGYTKETIAKLDKKKNKFPDAIPDGMQYTPHFVSGEYPGNGWAETFPPSDAGKNKKISNRRKRAKEKQQTEKEKRKHE